MSRRMPLIVLAATLAALAAAALFSRKGPPPARPLPPAIAKEVDSLRAQRRAEPTIPAGGVGRPDYAKRLERLRAAEAVDFLRLEEVVLDRREDVLLRIDLLNEIAARPGEPARLLCARLFADPEEPTALRLAALSGLAAYKDPHTFDVLRSVWESPRPFEGRHVLCTALGDCGQPGALPLLREGLGTSQSLEVRAHAALALGSFVAEAGVVEELARLAKSDAALPLRENALRALARGTSEEALRALREAEGDVKPLAEALLREREATSSPPGPRGR